MTQCVKGVELDTPDASIDLSHVVIHSMVREGGPGQFTVKDCLARQRLNSNEAVCTAVNFHSLHFMFAWCFKLERAKNILAVHSKGEIPQPETS